MRNQSRRIIVWVAGATFLRTSLGDAEFHHALSFDLNGFTGSRISTHTRFAIHQDQLAQSRECELVLGVLVCQSHERFQALNGLLLGNADGFRNGCDNL